MNGELLYDVPDFTKGIKKFKNITFGKGERTDSKFI